MPKEKIFCREARTYCGTGYMTVDLFRYSQSAQEAARAPRRRRERVSAPKQKNLNDKKARRYFVQLCNSNFGAKDYHVSLTYSPENLPENLEEAKREMKNYLRRVDRRRKKLGLEPLKYIAVTEGAAGRGSGRLVRVHHHIIVNGGLSREAMEALWTKERINWRKAEQEPGYLNAVRKIGFANCDSLQPGENGIEALARYLTKDPAGRKRWSCSQNLEKPVRVKNDHKYSVRQMENAARSGDIWARAWWEERYPGYTLAGSADMAVEAEPPDEMNGWVIFARLRKIENYPPGAGGNG
ncbi:MAG: hypothetical protein LUE22_00815 [Oscillospiraceae bacterium]|nr:hypothetical protein [Oscillospiraceae bacterium]